ncbi:hypothetical protein ACOZ4N_00280 (plasmid) [Halorientalis pallida]|uniref:hypothetical protein n=1 Tax=Halorientalis pallida TaxID=2479928 RepID=UPI003C6EB6D4
MNTYRLLFGLLLVAIAIPLATLQPAVIPSQTATVPQQCQPTPDRPVAGGGDAAISGTVAQATENQSIVEINYTAREQPFLDELYITLPPGATLVNQSGFDSAGGQSLDARVQRGDQLTLRYALTKLGRAGATAFENMSYVAGSDWVIAPTPAHNGADTTLQPAGSGVIGANMLYLGNYTAQTRTVGCQNITLVVPAAADLDPKPKLDSLSGAARSVSVGSAYSTVRIFASPQPITAVGGFVPRSQNNILIEADAPLRSAENPWVHEYIHTRQAVYEGQNFTWFQEASATYYAARLSLEQGLISSAAYDAALAQNAQYDPSTDLATANAEEVAYRWGAVVLARLDAALIQRGHTLAGVFDTVNREGTTYADFEAQLAQRGLNDSQLNETRATVLDGDRPDPAPAYTSQWQWLPRPLLAQWPLLLMVPPFLLGVIGSILVGDELSTWFDAIRGAEREDSAEDDTTADDD